MNMVYLNQVKGLNEFEEEMKMLELTGSEKQVAWAQEIRDRYTKVAEALRGIIDIYSDMAQKQIVEHDPIFGDETRTVYARNTNGTSHQAAIRSAHAWEPEKEDGKDLAWKIRRAADLKAAGEEHGERKAQVEYITATLANLERALKSEISASYWIDHR